MMDMDFKTSYILNNILLTLSEVDEHIDLLELQLKLIEKGISLFPQELLGHIDFLCNEGLVDKCSLYTGTEYLYQISLKLHAQSAIRHEKVLIPRHRGIINSQLQKYEKFNTNPEPFRHRWSAHSSLKLLWEQFKYQ
jgi:hypothetical protein